MLLGRRGRRGRHVLELERDDVDAAGERADGVEVVVGGVDFDVGDLAGRRVVLGRERVDPVAEPAGGDREHAAQLPAAEHADASTPGGMTRDMAAGRPRRHVSERARRRRHLVAVRLQLGAQLRPRRREDRHGQQPGVRGARGADGDRGDGHALRHLDDREQRIETAQRGALHRHADDRHEGVRGDHARADARRRRRRR